MREFLDAVAASAAACGVPAGAARRAVVVPRERDRGDLALPCFPFAREMRRAPHEIARDIAAAFRTGPLLDAAEAAGPFVNFRVNRLAWAERVLARIEEERADYGRSTEGEGKTVVLDYGSPNIAKPLLFHHLRSAVIGQSLANLHRRLGWRVVGVNFLGDLGTAFGKLMVGIGEFGPADTADALNETYVKASRLCAEDESKMELARVWAKRLEDGDPEAVRLWEKAREISLKGFERVYKRLGVRHDEISGEQRYAAPAARLVDELLKAGTARESEGAIVLDTGDPQLGVLLLRKRDGATLYQTRDLVAAIDRYDRWHFDRMLYVVDVAQERHFQQLFAGLKALGHRWADRCEHVVFGQVLMQGRRTKTREGVGVLLEEVLDEAEQRAAAIIAEKNPDLENAQDVARAVGIGAVIFSDLGTQIHRDVNFAWDEILNFDGRTGPYLQYAHASATSILRRAGVDEAPRGDPSLLAHDLEWQLFRRLAELPPAIERACAESEPSLVADQVYELAREFRAYHAAGGRDPALRVLTDDPSLRDARLRLVAAVRTALAAGLTLLGIEPVERM